MQYFELRLTLMNGMDIFIRDHQFIIHVEERKRHVKTLGDIEKPEAYYAAASMAMPSWKATTRSSPC